MLLLWTPGAGELVIIFLIVLLLFGGKKLPSLARSIGAGISEFKKGLSGQIPDEAEEPAPEQIAEKPKDKAASQAKKTKKSKA